MSADGSEPWPTCRHDYDLDHLTETQAEAVVFNCDAGLIHTDDDKESTG